MIFNSFEFIFLFLPIVFAVYYIIGIFHIPLAKGWLLIASLFFYAYWNPNYLPLVLISMVINYIVGVFMGRLQNLVLRKAVLTLGIIFNVGLLGYFKYYDFFISTINPIFGTDFNLHHLILPLAISFYTFTQIAYLVDSYRMETKEYNFLNYGLFVTFFPHLIAGPIVHHKQLAPQFSEPKNYRIQFDQISKGLLIFAIGLFKKVGIADVFADWANAGYATVDSLTFIDSWITTLSYTLQLYFDFSGYSDMAIGLALLFNITMPVNFLSPYKALDIQDFWRRWHITLSQFLTTYLYIPLGGNRKGSTRTYINIFIIFFVSGLWHGAGWTFIAWGVMHGVASIICRYWKKSGNQMPQWLAWSTTFMFVHLAWVFFRATSFGDAWTVLKAMFGVNGFYFPKDIHTYFPNLSSVWVMNMPFSDAMYWIVLWLVIGLGIVWFAKNSIEILDGARRDLKLAIFVAFLLVYSVMQLQNVSEFLYFNF